MSSVHKESKGEGRNSPAAVLSTAASSTHAAAPAGGHIGGTSGYSRRLPHPCRFGRMGVLTLKKALTNKRATRRREAFSKTFFTLNLHHSCWPRHGALLPPFSQTFHSPPALPTRSADMGCVCMHVNAATNCLVSCVSGSLCKVKVALDHSRIFFERFPLFLDPKL